MPELLLILLKINLVLLLFAAAYFAVLRRLTFYTLNRAFLATGILFSTIYPFINLTDFFHRQEQLNPAMAAFVPELNVNELVKNEFILSYWDWALIVFYLGVLVMAIRLFAQFISLYRVHRQSSPGFVRNLNVRILQGELSPFSFWQTVYVNPNLHSPTELDNILAHEQVHVKDWHTLDIILAEVSVVFYWFNPGVWLMKKAIKENIEFITDAKIVRRGVDKKAYQYSLLGVGNLNSSVALVNHFNLSDLKKRIKMMNAKRSSPQKLLIYAFLLPVLLLSTLAFTIDRKVVSDSLVPIGRAIKEVNIFQESPDTSPSTAVAVKLAAGKHGKQLLPIKTSDSSTRIHSFAKAAKLVLDSLPVMDKMNRVVRIIRAEIVGEEAKWLMTSPKTMSESDAALIDSIRRIADKPMVRGIQLFKREVPEGGENAKIMNEVHVIGYATGRKMTDSIGAKTSQPVFIVNGEELNLEDIKKIKAENIKSITVRAKVSGTMLPKEN